jgi:hypothetical protein
MCQIDARLLSEQFTMKMSRAGNSVAAVVVLFRVRLGKANELLERLRR